MQNPVFPNYTDFLPLRAFQGHFGVVPGSLRGHFGVI